MGVEKVVEYDLREVLGLKKSQRGNCKICLRKNKRNFCDFLLRERGAFYVQDRPPRTKKKIYEKGCYLFNECLFDVV